MIDKDKSMMSVRIYLQLSILGYILCFLFNMAGSSKKIPIGVLLDLQRPRQFSSSFQSELEQINNVSINQLVVDLQETRVNMNDNFQLNRAMCRSMSLGVYALLLVHHGLPTSASSSIIQSLSRTFHMPLITTEDNFLDQFQDVTNTDPHPDGSKQDRQMARKINQVDAKGKTEVSSAFTLYMRPSYHKSLEHMLAYYGWTNLVYVYDSQKGLANLERLYWSITKKGKPVRIYPVRLSNTNSCYAELRQVDGLLHFNNKYILLDIATKSALESVLQQIRRVGMNRANYHYLIGTLMINDLDLHNFRRGGANITGFVLSGAKYFGQERQTKDTPKRHHRNERSRSSNFSLETTLSLDALEMVHRALSSMLRYNPSVFKPRRGEVFNNGDSNVACRSDKRETLVHGPAIIEELKTINFAGATGPVSFNSAGERTNYELEVWEMNGDISREKVALWHSKSGLKIFKPRQDWDGRSSASQDNRTRLVTTIINPPYMMIRKQPEGQPKLQGNDRFEGFCADLADELALKLNFTYKIQLVKDGVFGERLLNGSWTGLVGELSRKETDMVIAPLTISSMRERVIDFSKPFMNLGISIMIKKPEKQKPGVFSFMDPLAFDIWMCIVVSYLAVSGVLFMVSRFSSTEWQIEEGTHGPVFTNDFTILNSMWFALGAFMRRGCDVCPRSLTGRIVGSAWWFFTLIIISSYTANLAAFLTIERMVAPINSADDLANQDTILYGTLDSGSSKAFFKHSQIPTYKKMWDFMSKNPSVLANSVENGVLKVRNSKGKYAFLMESPMNDYHNQRKPCNTMKVGSNLDSKGYGVATYIGSDLRDGINVAILQLIEDEVLYKLQKKWWYDKGECVVESDAKGGSSQSSLSLSNVAGIFYILIAGLGLSLLVATFEFLYKTKIDQKQLRCTDKSKSSTIPFFRYYLTADAENTEGYCYVAPQATNLSASSLDRININAHTMV